MSEDRLTQILENLAREFLSDSVRLRTIERQSQFVRGGSIAIVKPAGAGLVIQNEYIRASKGRRFFDALRTFPDGSHLHRQAYFDGRACTELQFNTLQPNVLETVVISNSFLDDMKDNTLSIPFPLKSYYVGPKALIDVIASAKPMPEGEVIGRPCDVFLFKAVGPPERREDFLYYLDKKTSVPLKVSCYVRQEHLAMDKPYWAWQAVTLDEMGERHVPSTSNWTLFAVKDATPDSAPRLKLNVAIKVDAIEFDSNVSESTFHPSYPEGTRVVDLVNHKAGRVHGRTKVATVADPIRVEEPTHAPWGIISALLLTFALIAGMLAVRSRRAHHSSDRE